jgi:putative peptide zinc metalloprotease protein
MGDQPRFRKDLIVSEHEDAYGKRTVVLKDPVSEKFFRLSLFEYQFLKLFDGTVALEEVLERLKLNGQYCSLEDGRVILGKAAQLGLMLGTKFGTALFQRDLRDRYEKAKKARLLSSIYFVYIPVLNPDAFLERTLWLFRVFANRWTAWTLALLAPGAIYFVFTGFPDLDREYTFFFNWENLLYLWITIALTKLFHELAHAYTAKSFGLHVPQMGVAFLIFLPCLYCNTTDAWGLADRRQRMAISAAGILAEAAVAVLAAYVWQLSGPGIVNSLAFYLMAVSFVSTVLFNGNPLMKFDGYFLLTDFLGLPNLQSKSLGYLKYLFMNRVLGLSLVTNTASNPRERSLFLTYGVSAFIYRAFLYTGIVAGVYFRFDKTIGIFLALLALCLFIVLPIIKGMKTLYANRSGIRPRLRGIVVLVLLVFSLTGATFIPWSSKSVYPCYVDSAKIQKLTVPLQTSVDKAFIRPGALVTKGTVLFELDVSMLKVSLLKKRIQRDVAKRELQALLLDAKERGKAFGKRAEVDKAEDEVRRVEEELRIALTSNIAPFDGAITTLDYKFQPGYQPGEGAVVGELRSVEDCVIRAFIPEKDRHKVQAGQEVEIWLPLQRGLTLKYRIDTIKPYSERDLRDSPFSSRVGGELATEVKGEQLKDAPLEAQYICSVAVVNNDRAIPLGITGRLVIFSPPQSLFSRSVHSLFNVFQRETIL